MLHRIRVVLTAGLIAFAPAVLANTAAPAAQANQLKTIEAMMIKAQVDEAIAAAEAWTEAEPKSADAWYMLGRTNGNKATRVNMFSAAGLARDSRNAYEKAVELDPKHVRARFDLIQFYSMAPGFMGGGADKAEAMAGELEKIDPVWGHLGRAFLAARAKDTAGAEKHYREALAIDPVHQQALNGLISLLIGTERLDDARTLAETTLQADANNPIGLYHVARYAAVTGKDLESGLEHMDKFLALSEIPTNLSMAAAHWRRGQILEKLGRKDEAVASITKAVSMDERLEDAKKDLERLKKA